MIGGEVESLPRLHLSACVKNKVTRFFPAFCGSIKSNETPFT